MKKVSRRVIGLFAVAAVLFSFTAVSCDNGNNSVQQTLQDLLNSTEKTTVDLSSEEFTLENSSAVILSKAITVTGGTSKYDLKDAVIIAKANGAKIDNVKNVEEIIVDEAIGSGEFTLSNSNVTKLTVNGGGADSIHINGCTIEKIVVTKTNVRVVLEGDSKVAAINLKAECALDSDSDSAEITLVAAENNVEEVVLKGKTNITAITASEEDFTITVDSNNITVGSAVIKTDDGKITAVNVEASRSDITVPEIKVPEGVTVTEEADEETPADDAEEEAQTCSVEYVTEYSSVEAITVDKGAELTAEQLKALTYDGYTFDGWYIGETKVEAGYKVTANVKLTAKWEKVEITRVKGITVTVNNQDDPVTDDDSIEVSWILDGSYILFTAPSGYSEYQWTFMDVISTTSNYKYQLYIHDNNPGVYPIYLYIPEAKKSATIYFTFTKE